MKSLLKLLAETGMWRLARKSKHWSIEDEINMMVRKGYIENDLTPIKCHFCNSEHLKDSNRISLDGWRDTLEYDRECLECEKVVGHWSYGHWTV